MIIHCTSLVHNYNYVAMHSPKYIVYIVQNEIVVTCTDKYFNMHNIVLSACHCQVILLYHER